MLRLSPVFSTTGTNLDTPGTGLKVSLDDGTNKIGRVTDNTGTEAVIEFEVPENTTEIDRTYTVGLYLNGAATGHSAVITVTANFKAVSSYHSAGIRGIERPGTHYGMVY